MSAGSFIRAPYVADYAAGAVHPIRVQPETLALTLNLPSGSESNTPTNVTVTDINVPISARVSGGRRGVGLFARLIRIRFTNNVPDGYLPGSVITLPLVRIFASVLSPGTTGTYLGEDIEVVGISPEITR